MLNVFLLIVIFHVKHYLCDYTFQNSYMLQKFKGGTDWIIPLAAHCGVHFAFTFVITMFIVPLHIALSLATLDFVVHFIMDRIKASPSMMGKFKALSAKEYPAATDLQKIHNTIFWNCLGLDQLVHHLTDLLVVALICWYLGYL